MYSYEEEILVNVRKIMRAIDRHSSFLMKIFGLTTPQLLCLKTIAESGPIAPGSLSKTVNLSHATVTGIVNRLEKGELVKKIPNKYDRRSVLIKVTRKGSSLLKKAPPMLHEFFLKKTLSTA